MSKLPALGRTEDLYGMGFMNPWLKQTKLSGVLSLFTVDSEWVSKGHPFMDFSM